MSDDVIVIIVGVAVVVRLFSFLSSNDGVIVIIVGVRGYRCVFVAVSRLLSLTFLQYPLSRGLPY